MDDEELASGSSPVSPASNGYDATEEYHGPPLSPRSDLYRVKFLRLQEKYDYIRLSNNRLRNRLYHVKKEITRLKRLKRILCHRLTGRQDKYTEAHLEIPDIVLGPSGTDKSVAESGARGSSAKRRKVADLKRILPVAEVDEITTMEQRARSSVISIIDSVITESHEERMRANAVAEAIEAKPFDPQIDMSDSRTELMLRPSSIDHLLPQEPDSDPGDVLNEFGETLDKNFMAED